MAETEYLTVHLSLKDIARLFSKIKVNPDTGCWEWVAGRDRDGYGKTYYKGRHERPHRVIFAWLVAPLPRGNSWEIPILDHAVCDNPPCCNPAHMKLVPHPVNVLRGKGRAAVNARKTHCKRGHELPKVPNRENGWRRCDACATERHQALWHGPRRKELLEKARPKAREYAHQYRNGPKREEVLRKKREAYQRANSDPQFRAEQNRRARERYRARKAQS